MCRVENMYKIRPLTAINNYIENLVATTTNHFLLGREIAISLLLPPIQRHQVLRKSSKTTQAYADLTWKR